MYFFSIGLLRKAFKGGAPTSHQSEVAKIKTQVTSDAGKDVEKEDHFSIVGGIANCYNHS